MFEDNDDLNFDDEPLPEETSNRTFMMVAGGMGALILLILVCIVVYFLVIRRGSTSTQLSQQDQLATVDAQNTAIQLALTATEEQRALLASPTVSITPSQTPVVAQPTETPLPPTSDPATATVAALQTQVAQATQTIIFTSTALPTTGFVDDVGIPGILGILVLLVAVILVARRLRVSPAE